MMADKRRKGKEQQQISDFAKSLSPTQTPTANGQSIFSPGGAEALKEGWLGGQPTETGMMQGAQLSTIQIMQKAIQSGLPLDKALAATRLAPRQTKPPKTTRSDMGFYKERGFSPKESKTLRDSYLGIKEKVPQTEKQTRFSQASAAAIP